ncbi:MAG: hypothetical protein RXR20_33425 [Paraburkholderia sp.]|jgi:hypothetical protein|uniref:hypothetical protein n=1 Tax=Burkholderiaceae TaxID=119060 RepID=UPI0010F4F6DE|nr:hypothetical protein [Burkholderia sp. 4M9327F10]
MANTEDGTSTSDASGVSIAPYDPMDKVETSTMKFGRQSGNGDRYYERPAEIENDTDADKAMGMDAQNFPKLENQNYFYRAMCRDEYDAWQDIFKQGSPELRARKYVALSALLAHGHKGWAGYREYSKRYLKEGQKYTHLLEVYAPGFVRDMKSIGYKSGKAESGDLSWGLGLASSNSFAADTDAVKLLRRIYGEAKKNNSLLLATGESIQAKAKSLAPYFFCIRMESMKTVNIRSTKNRPTAETLKEPQAGTGSNAKKGRGGKKK